MSGVRYSTVIGAAGSRVVNCDNISLTVRARTNRKLSSRYTSVTPLRLNFTGVAKKCGLSYGCMVRASKPV